MTLAMPDSTNVADLPPGFPAYLGYADGQWPTAAELAARFPAAKRIILTVTGSTFDADGIDCEPGNVNAAMTRVWVQRKLAAAPDSRPVVYASVQGVPNFGMGDILARLNGNRISRQKVRLLSAHYGAGEHICGPDTCGLIEVAMDGTQWTNAYPGVGGCLVDMSVLVDGFFGESWTEKIMQDLPVVREGDTGPAVRTVQGLCCSRGHSTKIDGVFGVDTYAAVRSVQADGRLAQDGVVGRLTWPVLLGLTP